MDEITYWSKQEIFTKDGLHYRLKGQLVCMESDFEQEFLYSRYDYIVPRYDYSITVRILEGPLARIRGVDNERGMFKFSSWQDAIDAGFLELVAPIKH